MHPREAVIGRRRGDHSQVELRAGGCNESWLEQLKQQEVSHMVDAKLSLKAIL